MEDVFDLERFVEAQGPVSDRVMRELEAARKTSHWMWFVFPQIAGLGTSPMAVRFAITSLDEAKAYLAHPILGARLRRCTRLVNAIEGRSALDVFGSPDDLKLRSSLTLFARAAPDETLFADSLDKYFGGVADPKTLERL
jgi:uncharacterized protein (DUF1810 family)